MASLPRVPEALDHDIEVTPLPEIRPLAVRKQTTGWARPLTRVHPPPASRPFYPYWYGRLSAPGARPASLSVPKRAHTDLPFTNPSGPIWRFIGQGDRSILNPARLA